MDKLPCLRPNCDGVVDFSKAYGNVELELERSPEADASLAVLANGRVCANCSVDLAEWWNRGKK
jgi:hypothetical protein